MNVPVSKMVCITDTFRVAELIERAPVPETTIEKKQQEKTRTTVVFAQQVRCRIKSFKVKHRNSSAMTATLGVICRS